ncbi:MAG TPA: 3-hydroxybutyrate dehydrogenase [Chloroflexota bacterium]|nr:3-hydroxybutyrate dehydrogenase [Chloroflexota bacterium]
MRRMMSQGNLAGKSAIVTGAAGGIGRAIAKELASLDASVLVVDLDEKQGATLTSALPDAAFFRADLSVARDCHEAVQQAVNRWGGIDILINNAGLQHVSPVEAFPEEQWEHLIQTMLIAPFRLIRSTLPYMYARRWGRIVNIASIHGLVASPFKSAYVAAKHGLVGFTKTVALEAADKGVTVNAVCPSYVRTPLVERQIVDQAAANGVSEGEVVERLMLAPAAIKRLLEPSEVAAYVAFLCSHGASGITGATQVIDCGWTAR